jgi:hypothetical protein
VLVVNSFPLESDFMLVSYTVIMLFSHLVLKMVPYQHIDGAISLCFVRSALKQYRPVSLSTKCPCDRLVQ